MATLPQLPRRRADSSKGDYGRVLVVAGSYGMAGAAMLCVRGALRSGAGLVHLAAPDRIYDPLAAALPCAVIRPMPSTRAGTLSQRAIDPILEAAAVSDAVALGPGLSRHPETVQAVRDLLRRIGRPVVLDADGINAFEGGPARLADAPGPRVLTPHPGEMARLMGTTIETVQAGRREAALRAAKASGAVVVLKGHRTVVTDGRRVVLNRTGNPGMATGGSGDVLTGVIAALIGQGLAPFAAAVLGARLHGRAGDLAARRLGMISLTASDIVDFLPAASRKPY